MRLKLIYTILFTLLVVFSAQAQLKKPTVPAKKETVAKPQVKAVERVVEKDNDRDGDGIIDSMDECPNQYGKMENRGCPDSDVDGIVDSKDKCPDVWGLISND